MAFEHDAIRVTGRRARSFADAVEVVGDVAADSGLEFAAAGRADMP